MLPTNLRLTDKKSILYAIKQGFSIQGQYGYFKIQTKYENSAGNIIPSQFTIIVPAKVEKLATKRNRIKRWLRAAIIKFSPKIQPGYNVVYIATQKGKNHLDYEQEIAKLSSLRPLTSPSPAQT